MQKLNKSTFDCQSWINSLIWQLTVYDSQINSKMAAMIAINEDIARPGPAITVPPQPSDGLSTPSMQLKNKNSVNFTANPTLGMTSCQVGI